MVFVAGVKMMLESLKQTGRHISHEINRAWTGLEEGWLELFAHGTGMETSPETQQEAGQVQGKNRSDFPHISVLSAEIEKAERDILMNVELHEDPYLPLREAMDAAHHLEGEAHKPHAEINTRMQ